MDETSEYRGMRYRVEARRAGPAWVGHYLLLGLSEAEAAEAADQARLQWVPLEPAWATENEARTNASEGAQAAIDALLASRGAES
ncbi:hypothetical protein [Roseateles violae]|uniref:SPOR domain-containing protein n=1 Tax=Roseateles violae TaxID=3058042 RepID=A0ABT8DT48_9BURK|nr:hypothetical protein [Pelomonas sp. PFR6]MDN3919484.1 hypothetical protein [Pelomonas sp. PFR6]